MTAEVIAAQQRLIDSARKHPLTGEYIVDADAYAELKQALVAAGHASRVAEVGRIRLALRRLWRWVR